MCSWTYLHCSRSWQSQHFCRLKFVHVCVSLWRTTLSPLFLLFPSSLMTFSAVTQSCGVIASETVLAVLTAPCWVTPRCQITRYVGMERDTEFKNGVRWINPCPPGNWQHEQHFKSFLPIHESPPETGMSIRAAPKKNAKCLNKDMQSHCSSCRGTYGVHASVFVPLPLCICMWTLPKFKGPSRTSLVPC